MKELLESANAHLIEIIRLINQALADIKQANKDKLNTYNEQIKAQMQAFIDAKKTLDSELLALASANPEAELSELLSEAELEQLKYLRLNLNSLRTKNTEYASIIISLKDFYDDLLNSMLGLDDNYSEHFKR